MIATQDYGWSQLARRAGLTWPEATGWAMDRAVEAGFAAWEPLVHRVEDVIRIGALARARGLALPSVFLTGVLYDRDQAATTRAAMLAAAHAAAGFGCRRVMVYPSPLRGALPDKSDPELAIQAVELEALGQALAPLGISLCYHPEDGEMRHAAREFHHMLLATDPALVRLCLDPDTVWRGAGQSQLALLDIVTLHGHRTDAMHLRQSVNGIWHELLGPGDLDYPVLMTALAEQGARPALILELAYEDRTIVTLDPIAAHRQSLGYLRSNLAPLLAP